ncbi:MAG: hypothetical protein ACI9GH_000083 [Candidatus Paceibacteria bacterium]|jgi:hypothetical protein
MLRLLLENDRKNIKTEYRFRFFTLLSLVVVSTIVAWIIFLLPSYLVLSVEENEYDEKIKKIEESSLSKERAELTGRVSEVNKKVSILDTKDYDYAELVGAVRDVSDNGVDVDLIEFTHDDDGVLAISVRGISSGRDNLLDFSKKLEDYDRFEKAEFPFSDFAKESEIPFSITVTVVPL